MRLRPEKLPFQAVLVGCSTAVYSLLFSKKTDLLSFDGQLSAALSDYQIRTFGRSLSLRSDFLFGVGGMQGGYQFWLDPVSIVGSIGAQIYNQFAVAVVLAMAIFVLATLLFRSFGQSGPLSSGAGFLTVIATIWGYSIALVDSELFGHVPQYASILIVALAILNCFSRFGKSAIRMDAFFGFSFVVLIAYLLVVLTHIFVTALPLLAVLILVSLKSALQTKKEFFKKVGLLSFVVLFLIAFHAPEFLLGFYLNTAASEYPLGVYNQPQLAPVYRFVFETFFPTPSASGNYYFQFLAFFVMAIFVFSGFARRSRRGPMWLAVVLSSVLLIIYRLWESTWVVESGPRINYFVWMLAPLYALGFINGVLLVFGFLKRVKWINAIGKSNTVRLSLLCLTALGLFFTPLSSLRFSLKEPKPLTLDEIRFDPMITASVSTTRDSRFRGRAAYLMQQPNYPSAVVGRVPLFNDYSHNLTPTGFLFNSDLLLDENSNQQRLRFVFGTRNLHIYRMLGVKFVVVPNDSLTDPERDVEYVGVEAGSGNRILELSDPNLGNYSPTNILVEDSLRDIFTSLGSPDFDGRRDVIFDSEFSSSVVAASSGEIENFKGDLRVKGKSEGVSMLLLPLEYSSCLKVDQLRGSKGFLELRRANGLLTALIFDREIDVVVKLRFGLFENPTCRLDDLREFRRLNG